MLPHSQHTSPVFIPHSLPPKVHTRWFWGQHLDCTKLCHLFFVCLFVLSIVIHSLLLLFIIMFFVFKCVICYLANVIIFGEISFLFNVMFVGVIQISKQWGTVRKGLVDAICITKCLFPLALQIFHTAQFGGYRLLTMTYLISSLACQYWQYNPESRSQKNTTQ